MCGRRRTRKDRWPQTFLYGVRHSMMERMKRVRGVKTLEAVVMASDGPVLGLRKPPKHQGEARPRLNTCASRAGARRTARGDPKDVS